MLSACILCLSALNSIRTVSHQELNAMATSYISMLKSSMSIHHDGADFGKDRKLSTFMFEPSDGLVRLFFLSSDTFYSFNDTGSRPIRFEYKSRIVSVHAKEALVGQPGAVLPAFLAEGGKALSTDWHFGKYGSSWMWMNDADDVGMLFVFSLDANLKPTYLFTRVGHPPTTESGKKG